MTTNTAHKTDILGIGFHTLSLRETVNDALEIIKARGGYVVTPNPEIVWESRKNSELRDAVNKASLVLPDGIGIIHAAKILKRPLTEKVAGIDFAAELMAELAKKSAAVCLLGAKPGVAEKAGEALAAANPGLRIAGAWDGYTDLGDTLIAQINEKKPELLLVCLGSPKQELWMAQNASRLDVGLMAGLGGAMDVFAGVTSRAPQSWQRLGMEWLYRLLKEPRRIGRAMRLPKFLFAVLAERMRI